LNQNKTAQKKNNFFKKMLFLICKNMKKIQYFKILKHAFLMVWKNKFLWLFGLLIFLGSLPSNLSFNGNGTAEQSEKAWATILNYIQKYPKIFVGLILLLIVLIIILFVLKIIATAAIIKSVNNIAVYGQSKISAIFSETRKYFWQLALLEIIIGLAFTIIIVILIVPVIYLWILKAKVLAVISAIIATIIFLTLTIIAQYLRKYAYFYVVLGNMKIKMAFEAAYVLFVKNIWESLIMGLIGIAVSIVAMMLSFILVLFLAIICAPFGLIAYLVFAKTGALVILILGIVISVLGMMILFSYLTAFIQSAWVLFFQEISLEKKEENKIFEKIEGAEKIPDPEVI
jgi:hypothetical protein